MSYTRKTPRPLPSQARLRQLLDYDPKTGKLTWRRDPENLWKEGREAFAYEKSGRGYLRGRIDGNMRLAHRVVFKWVYGKEPAAIDHINGLRWDNRIENLRNSSTLANGKNVKMLPTNTSGYCGVSWVKSKNKWRVQIKNDGKTETLGYFISVEEASQAYRHRADELGFSKRHGKIQYDL